MILAGGVYEVLSSPYETWVKNKLFKDLESSRERLEASVGLEKVIASNSVKPIHLIWTGSDKMFGAQRYEQAEKRYANQTGIHFHREEGTHLWLFEQSHKAAELIQKVVRELLDSGD